MADPSAHRIFSCPSQWLPSLPTPFYFAPGGAEGGQKLLRHRLGAASRDANSALFFEDCLGLLQCLFHVGPTAIPAGLGKDLADLPLADAQVEGVPDVLLELPHVPATHQRYQDADRALLGSQITSGPRFSVVISINQVGRLWNQFLGKSAFQVRIGLDRKSVV